MHAAITANVTLTGELNFNWLRGRDEGARDVVESDEFILTNFDATDFVFADHSVRPPEHFFRDGVREGLSVHEDRAIGDLGIPIEFPALKVVTGSGGCLCNDANPASAQVVVEGVG